MTCRESVVSVANPVYAAAVHALHATSIGHRHTCRRHAFVAGKERTKPVRGFDQHGRTDRIDSDTPTKIGACVIAPLAATFRQRYPLVRVDLELSNRNIDLIDEGFDLAIRIGELGDADLIARPLTLYRMVICASPGYLAQYGRPETPRDLGAHHCLSHTVWSSRHGWKLGDDSGTDFPAEAVFTCNDGNGLRMAAIAGAGLLLQPEVLVSHDLASGALVQVLHGYSPKPHPVHIVYRYDRRPLPKLTRFVAHLLEHVTERDAP